MIKKPQPQAHYNRSKIKKEIKKNKIKIKINRKIKFL